MGASRPDSGSPASFYISVLSLCNVTDDLLTRLAAAQQGLATAQQTILAEQAAINLLTQAIGNEGKYRQNDVDTERKDRIAQIELVQKTLQAAIDLLTTGLHNEADYRQYGDGVLTNALDALRSTVESLQSTVRNLADTKADIRALAQVGDSQSEALAGVVVDQDLKLADALARVEAVTDAISAAVADQRIEFLAPEDRPGDAPLRFAYVSSPYALTGAPAVLPAIPDAMLTTDAGGGAVRIIGSGIVGMRDLRSVESGRVYRARIVMQRLADPSDPANDAVQFGIVFLDAFLNPLLGGVAVVVVEQMPNLRSSDGRSEIQAILARAVGDRVQVVAPPRARYARAYLRTFGPDGVTAVEVLGIADVSDALLADPVSANLVAQIAALESVTPGPRLDRIEGQLAAPNALAFRSKSEAVEAAIPASVVTITLLGGTLPGDGRQGQYRQVGALPAGADGFTCADGTIWQRVPLADDLIGADLFGWLSRLPVQPDLAHGGWWNNAGRPTYYRLPA